MAYSETDSILVGSGGLNALHWDGTHLWCGGRFQPYIYRVDPNGTIVATIDMSAAVAVNNARKITSTATHVFVATLDDGKIVVIEKSSNTVVGVGAALTGTTFYRSIAVDNSGNVYAAAKFTSGGQSGQLHKWSISTLLSSFPVEVSATSITSFAPRSPEEVIFDGTDLWVSQHFVNLHKIDTSGTILSSYAVPTGQLQTLHIAFGSIWVTSSFVQQVYRFDLATFPAPGSLLATIPTSESLFGLTDDGTNIVLGSQSSPSILVLDPGSNTFIQTLTAIDTSDRFQEIAYDGTYVWGATSTSSVGNYGLRQFSEASPGFTETPNESLTLTEGLSLQQFHAISVSETLSLIEAVTGRKQYISQVGESLSLSESVAAEQVYEPDAPEEGYWGSGTYGEDPWGGLGDFTKRHFETLGLVEALGITKPTRVVSASAPNSFLVDVYFRDDIDQDDLTNLDTSNYAIPGITVLEVLPGIVPKSVRLRTTEQGAAVYTLTVTTIVTAAGDDLDPAYATATFPGFDLNPTFFATAQSRRKVLLTVSTQLLADAALSNPASYTIATLSGVAIPVTTAGPSGPTPVTRVTLELGSDLQPGGFYVATIGPAVQTVLGFAISPPTDLFQWMETPSATNGIPITVQISDFSGEVSGGILGTPAGQVFFSPSLDAPAPNSSIQVDTVSVCTRAFDVYEPPSIPDPVAFFTYGPNQPASLLGGAVLWAPADRLGQARMDLSDFQEDTLTAPVDGPADAVLVETIDTTRASFLNDTRWQTFPGTITFSTADNLTPIGPGPTVNINLQP